MNRTSKRVHIQLSCTIGQRKNPEMLGEIRIFHKEGSQRLRQRKHLLGHSKTDGGIAVVSHVRENTARNAGLMPEALHPDCCGSSKCRQER